VIPNVPAFPGAFGGTYPVYPAKAEPLFIACDQQRPRVSLPVLVLTRVGPEPAEDEPFQWPQNGVSDRLLAAEDPRDVGTEGRCERGQNGEKTDLHPAVDVTAAGLRREP
jgi:hypothetical protein